MRLNGEQKMAQGELCQPYYKPRVLSKGNGEPVKCSAQLSDVIRFVVSECFLEETSTAFNTSF